MNRFREKVSARGTADCPFQRYAMKHSSPGAQYANIHWHPEAEILYMREGTVEVRVDKYTFPLTAGQIPFVPPGQLHAIRGILPSSYDAFVFSLDLLTLPDPHFFQKELINPLRSGALRFPYILLPTDAPYPTVSSALNHICQSSRDDPHRKRQIFSSMILLFTAMMDCLEPGSSDSLQKSNEIVKSCLAYMNQHYSEHLTLKDIADQVHLHPNYLCALFKDYSGQTVFQHLIRIRIEKAAEMLQVQNISVSDAAAACGFENSCYFTKKFKSLIGVTPKAYSLLHR